MGQLRGLNWSASHLISQPSRVRLRTSSLESFGDLVRKRTLQNYNHAAPRTPLESPN
jgi:hypothetical protein